MRHWRLKGLGLTELYVYIIDTLPAKLSYLNFYLCEVVSRYRDSSG